MWLIFCAFGSPPGRAGRGRLFCKDSALVISSQVWGDLPSGCSWGCRTAVPARSRCAQRSSDAVDPFSGRCQQQQRRSRRQRRRWRHLRPAAAARRRRDGQGLDNTGCGQSAIWAHGKSSCQSMAWEKLTMAWEKLTLVVGGSHMPLFERSRRCRSIAGTAEDL